MHTRGADTHQLVGCSKGMLLSTSDPTCISSAAVGRRESAWEVMWESREPVHVTRLCCQEATDLQAALLRQKCILAALDKSAV
jgi:hypothetical protein